MNAQTLRLTPSNSPFWKSTTPRSPTKTRSEEAGLRLKKIIGTTTASSNGFDVLPSKKQFAYCAGAAAVVATVDDELKVTQRFFRARPTAGNTSREGNGGFPATPTPSEARSRALGHVREHNIGGSPLGASTRDWSDSPSGKTATAKDRVKAATSVALSPNGKWVALGETGYKPRILIFANGSESSESPVCALAEHTFGVQALSFSPDSKCLASLGTVNDGFLYLWSIDDRSGAASLHSSNKCTVMINDLVWIGRSLVTVGLRFVKVWKPTEDSSNDVRHSEPAPSLGTPKQKNVDFGNSILSPKQKVLPGKNTLLGDLLDCNFVSAVPIANDQGIVCSESGEIAILDDVSKTQSLRPVAFVDFSISAARVEPFGTLQVSGHSGRSQTFNLRELQQSSPASGKRERRQSASPVKTTSRETPIVTATAAFVDIVLEMDSRRNIRLTRSTDDENDFPAVASHQLPAHNDAVLGIRTLSSTAFPDAAFFTFAGNGVVRLWSAEGAAASASLNIPVESSPDMYDQSNELRAVAPFNTDVGEYLVAGDKYGTLTIFDIRTGVPAAQVRAHSSEVADVIAFERSAVQLVATCSRDRTIQLFTWRDDQLDLVQTLDEHAAAVNGLLSIGDGETLLSYSQDRTVIVREAMERESGDPSTVVYGMARSIALKSSPTCICPGLSKDEILVSAMDRCIGLYNVKTSQTGFNFKCSDGEGGEAVAMSRIAYEPSLNGNPTIIGISGSDKSVRLYSEFGTLIARDWGHTEGITDLAVLRSRISSTSAQSEHVQVVTVAADSTVFIWDTVPPSSASDDPAPESNGATGTPNASSTPLRPPLRKVLSYSELSRFKREKSIDDGNDSPSSTQRQTSPQRIKRKPSKISIAQAPKLEPPFRGEHARRRSLRKRSPSPPSPRTRKDATVNRKPSLGMTLRSKSSENVLNGVTSPTSTTTTTTGFGSLTASTESVCRTLRTYRKRVSTPSALESVPPDTLRELETELQLLAEALGDRLPGGAQKADMARALEEASERIVSRLDERIRERVEDEMRKSAEDGGGNASAAGGRGEGDVGGVEAVTGAMEKVGMQE